MCRVWSNFQKRIYIFLPSLAYYPEGWQKLDRSQTLQNSILSIYLLYEYSKRLVQPVVQPAAECKRTCTLLVSSCQRFTERPVTDTRELVIVVRHSEQIPWGRLKNAKFDAKVQRNMGWLGSRVVSVLDSGTEACGFKSQSRRCRVTVSGKLFTPTVPLFTKQQNW